MSEFYKLSPLDRFRKGPHAGEHLKWSSSETSKAAIEAALAYMASTNKGADLIHLQGATLFAGHLLELAVPKEESKTIDRSNIDNARKPKP